jgi:hypothetical protein
MIRMMVKIPNVSRKRDQTLTQLIRQIHADSKGVYGAPCIRAELQVEYRKN